MLHPNTISFLEELSINNKREWFLAHKEDFEEIKKTFEKFVYRIAEKINKFDKTVKPVKDDIKIFRIYRDARFSKDKSPYKTNLGAFISYGGMKSPYAGYYIHIEPSESSGLAGGKHNPDSSAMSLIRNFIAGNYMELEKLLKQGEFKKYFPVFGGEDTALKTVPRGFDKAHPAREFLRQKSFTVWHPVDDDVVLSDDFDEYIIDVFRQLYKLNSFLNRSIV